MIAGRLRTSRAMSWSIGAMQQLLDWEETASAFAPFCSTATPDPPPEAPDPSVASKTPEGAVELNKHILGVSGSVIEEYRQQKLPKDDHRLEGPEFEVVGLDHGRMPMLELCLDRLHALLLSKIDRVDHVNVATILHQLGALGVESQMQRVIREHRLTKELLLLVLEKLNHFEAKHVANIVWALSCLGHESLDVQIGKSTTGFHVIESLLMHAIRIIATFIPQSIAQLAHALARLDVLGAREFMPLLAVVSKNQLDGFTLRDTSVFMYALASLQYEDHVGLIPPLLARIEVSFHKMTMPQQMSNIMWSLPKLVKTNTEALVPLLEAAGRWTLEHMDAFKTMEFASYMQSMGQLQFLPSDAFFKQLDEYCANHLDEFLPLELATILVACAKFDHRCWPLLEGLEGIEGLETARDVPSTTISIIWSLAILDELTLPRVRWAAQFLDDDSFDLLPIERRMQFGQALATMRMMSPDITPDEIFPANLVQGCWELWMEKHMRAKIPSLMRSYFYTLQRLGYHCEVKVLEKISISTSTAEHPCGHRLVIEIDTPLRRFINAPHKCVGRVLWRWRMLEAEGWTVLRINRERFLQYDVSEQIRYIQDQLDQLFPPSKETSVDANC